MDAISGFHLVAFKVLAGLGALVVVSYVIGFLHGVYARCLRGGKNIVKKFGKWAVVTGATDGIGKAMAFELAKKGCDILLISRSLDKLNACKDELSAKYPSIKVEVLNIDFSQFDAQSTERVKANLKGKDIGVLVNNVGVSYPFTKYFHELDDKNVEDLITLNVDSTTWMTRFVLPAMLEQKRGAIVNISSAAGVSTSPLLAQYGAAKSYIAMFTRALNAEYAGKGIHVQCQVPLFVATKLAKIKRTSIGVPSPAAYARSAIAAIGYETVVSPYWSHAIQLWAITNLPEWLVTKVVMGMHLGIRKSGMAKEAKSKEDKKD